MKRKGIKVEEEPESIDNDTHNTIKAKPIFMNIGKRIDKNSHLDAIKVFKRPYNPTYFSHEYIPTDFGEVYEGAQYLYNSFLETLFRQMKDEKIIEVQTKAVSPNGLQADRFPETGSDGNKSIRIVPARLMVNALGNFLKEGTLNRTQYIRGPKGIGKSYLVLLLVWILRNQNGIRVLYINNPKLCRMNYWQYIRNEIIYYIFKDGDDPNLPVPPSEAKGENRLEQWYNYITFEDNKFEAIKTCLNKLRSFFNKKEIQVLFIIDQENVIQRFTRSVDASEKNFADLFFKIFDHAFCKYKILVASENNECYKISKDTPQKYFSALFNTKDNVSFLKDIWKSSLPIIPIPELEELDTNNLNKELEEILKITNRIPLELRKFVEIANNQNFDNLEDISNAYFKSRSSEYLEIHKRYCRNLPNGNSNSSYEIILALDTGIPFLDPIDDYDQESIVKLSRNDQDGIKYAYTSLCPVAQKAIEEYYIIDRNTNFMNWFNNDDYVNRILAYIIENQAEFTGTMYGSPLKKLIIWKMIAKTNITLNYWTVKARKLKKVTLNINQCRNFNTKYFLQEVKEIGDFGIPVLLIPKSPIYSLVDCILVVPKKLKYIIYLFQITANIETHDKRDDEIALQLKNENADCKHNICKVNLYYNNSTHI